VLPSDHLGLTSLRLPVDIPKKDTNMYLKRYLMPLLGFEGFLSLTFGAISEFSQAALELIAAKPSALSSCTMGRIFEMREEDPISSAGNLTLCRACSTALTAMDAVRVTGCSLPAEEEAADGGRPGPSHPGEELVCAERRVLRRCQRDHC